jgi:hypothetical protein
MVGGRPWTDEENKLLQNMIAPGQSFQEIFDSGEFPDGASEAIRIQLLRLGAQSPAINRC